MIYGFFLNHFRYGPVSAASRCSAIIDDKRKTLKISNLYEGNIFSGLETPLETISSISFGQKPCTMMLGIDMSASKSASERGGQIFLDFQPAPERDFFYKVLKKECNKGKLQVEDQDRAFRRWEDKISETPEEELDEQAAVQRSATGPLPEEVAMDVHVSQPETTTEPNGGYQRDDMLPFQISQVLRVLNGYEHKEQQLQDVREELAVARGQIARHRIQIAALAAALVSPDAMPVCRNEQDLHKYLASPSIGLRSDEIAALNDVPQYRQAFGLEFRKAGARKSAK